LVEHAANPVLLPQVVVEEDPGLIGNLLVERMVGAHIELVTKEEYVKHGSMALGEQLKQRLQVRGLATSLARLSERRFTSLLWRSYGTLSPKPLDSKGSLSPISVFAVLEMEDGPSYFRRHSLMALSRNVVQPYDLHWGRSSVTSFVRSRKQALSEGLPFKGVPLEKRTRDGNLTRLAPKTQESGEERLYVTLKSYLMRTATSVDKLSIWNRLGGSSSRI
jgi:hypothetical protein